MNGIGQRVPGSRSAISARLHDRVALSLQFEANARTVGAVLEAKRWNDLNFAKSGGGRVSNELDALGKCQYKEAGSTTSALCNDESSVEKGT